MTGARPVLEVDGVGKRFGPAEVLKSAGFSAWPGRTSALMGRNGVGKSTLLRIAIGRVRPDYGRVLYKGRFLSRPSLAQLARDGLMYGAQESSLTGAITLDEHFRAFGARYGGGERLAAIVEALGLGELLTRRPAGLSGGERQRAMLGLALLRAPDCLLMDEPFAGVAPKDRPLIAAALGRLRGEGTAVVISGHEVDDLFAVADEVVWVASGTTHSLGAPERAAGHHQFRREYLGPRGSAGKGRSEVRSDPL